MTHTVPLDHSLTRLITACEKFHADVTVSDEGFKELLQRFMPRAISHVRDGFKVMTTWDYSSPEVMHLTQIRMRMRGLVYTDIENLLVDKPVGFTGRLSDHIHWLHTEVLPVMVSLEPKVLRATAKGLGEYLNDPDRLKEMRVGAQGAEISRNVLETLIERLGTYRIDNNRSSEGAFGDLFWSNQDFQDAAAALNEVNSERWVRAKPNHVAATVAEVQQVAEALLQAVETDKLPMSREVSQFISGQIEVTARWVEWYSLMTAQIIDVTTAMKRTEKTLLRI